MPGKAAATVTWMRRLSRFLSRYLREYSSSSRKAACSDRLNVVTIGWDSDMPPDASVNEVSFSIFSKIFTRGNETANIG